MAISHTPLPPVAPGATVGILGSGQLGRMLALAAANLGLKTHIFAPDRGPACDVSTFVTIAPYEDEQALAAFADAVAVVTYEFENVPAATAAFLSARLPVLPDALALATTQDRLVEKDFLNGIGIATAPYKAVDDAGSLARAVAQIGRPSILKTRRFGYDGKGQACILEGTVPFVREVSVIAARGRDGSFAAWDVCENEHEHHILSRTLVPAQIAATTAHQATEITRRIVDALGYVGVIAVEMFVVEDKRSGTESLIVNEIAPRVHNSGHWTIDGAVTSQFAQHIRAICGWPLGSPRRHGRIEMRNLIGEDIHLWRDILGDGAAGLHIYGKHEARNGRKMGHVTRVLPEESAE